MVFSLFTIPDAPAASAKKSASKPGLPLKNRGKDTRERPASPQAPASLRRSIPLPQAPASLRRSIPLPREAATSNIDRLRAAAKAEAEAAAARAAEAERKRRAEEEAVQNKSRYELAQKTAANQRTADVGKMVEETTKTQAEAKALPDRLLNQQGRAADTTGLFVDVPDVGEDASSAGDSVRKAAREGVLERLWVTSDDEEDEDNPILRQTTDEEKKAAVSSLVDAYGSDTVEAWARALNKGSGARTSAGNPLADYLAQQEASRKAETKARWKTKETRAAERSKDAQKAAWKAGEAAMGQARMAQQRQDRAERVKDAKQAVAELKTPDALAPDEKATSADFPTLSRLEAAKAAREENERRGREKAKWRIADEHRVTVRELNPQPITTGAATTAPLDRDQEDRPEWLSSQRDELGRSEAELERIGAATSKGEKTVAAQQKKERAEAKAKQEAALRRARRQTLPVRTTDASARTEEGRRVQQLYALMGEGYSADPGTVVDRSYSTSVDEKGADKVGVSAKEFINDFTKDQQGAIQVNTEVLSAIENDTANYGRKNKDGNRYTTLNEVSEADVRKAGFKNKAAYEDAMAIVYGKGPWQRQEKEIIFAPELLTTLIGFGVRDNVGDLKEDYKGVNLMTEDRLKQMGEEGTIDAAAVNKSTADLVESLSEGTKPSADEILDAAYARSEAGGGAGLYSAASQAQSWNTIANNLRSGYYVGPDGTKTYMEGRYAGTADMDAYQRGILDSLRKDDIDWDFLALRTASDLGRWREKNKGALEPSFNAFFNKDFQVRQNMYGIVYSYILNNADSEEEVNEVINSPENMKELLSMWGVSGGNVNAEWTDFIRQMGKETGSVLGDTVTPSSQAGTLTADTNGEQAYVTALNELMSSVASEEEFKTLMSNPSSVRLALGAAGIDSSLYDYNTLYGLAQQAGKVE